jgi:osmotically inducible lipoprotein OsmB
MRRIISAVAAAGLVLGLAACGHNTEQRAATGAGTGLLIAGPVGAAVGAGVGVVVSKSKGSTSKSTKKR